MDETRAKILEQQLDALAGTAKTIESQMKALVEILHRPRVSETLGLTFADLSPLQFPKDAYGGAHNHRDEREKRLRKNVREAAIDRLIREQQQRDQEQAGPTSRPRPTR